MGNHEHPHAPNRFAVIPTHARLNAHPKYKGKGVTIAFLDSGFFPHPDLVQPRDRVVVYEDLEGELKALSDVESHAWQWHGTQTSVAAAGNGGLCGGVYRGLASEAELALVKVSKSGRITEENIERGIRWVIANRERYNIRVLNISLGGDEDVPCSQSIIDQAAEEAIRKGIVVVVAAGNSGHEGKHSIPPANSPSVITVGGYTDHNQVESSPDLYQSNFGLTADGTLKPEVIAPAMWVAAPILPSTADYVRAETLSLLAHAADYELPSLARKLSKDAELPPSILSGDAGTIRNFVESILKQRKIVATHYQHVDGTSFAAPIVTSIVAQMLEGNPALTPAAIKDILISTAARIPGLPVIRQGYGVVNARRAVERAVAETHRLEAAGVERVNGKVLFAYHDDNAKSVAVAGEFNNWRPSLMRKNHDGFWRVEISSPASGRYAYKFVVNRSNWVEDPRNGMKVMDSYGGFNSVLIVK